MPHAGGKNITPPYVFFYLKNKMSYNSLKNTYTENNYTAPLTGVVKKTRPLDQRLIKPAHMNLHPGRKLWGFPINESRCTRYNVIITNISKVYHQDQVS